MTTKKQSAESTFIYTADSSIGSLPISRIQYKKPHQIIKGLSSSFQTLRNPFTQVLPLKFPKKKNSTWKLTAYAFIINLLHKPCIRTSQIRNKHDIEFKIKKGLRIFHKNNLSSEDNNIYQLAIHSNSYSNSLNSSPQKKAKRMFQHLIIRQSMKDPILVGQTNKHLMNASGKKYFNDQEKNKNLGQGIKESLQWKIQKSVQKQKFNSRFNIVPTLNLENKKLQTNIKPTKESYQVKKLTKQKQKKIAIKGSEKPKTARGNQKPLTYSQMYASRKLICK